MLGPTGRSAVASSRARRAGRGRLRVARHLEHRRAEATCPKHALGGLVADHRREDDARRAGALEGGDDRGHQRPTDARPARAAGDEDIVKRAVPVEEHVPVAALHGAVRVPDRLAVANGDENDGPGLRELARKPPRVALFDAVDEQEPVGIGVVVHAHELTGEPAEAREIAGFGGSDDDGIDHG